MVDLGEHGGSGHELDRRGPQPAAHDGELRRALLDAAVGAEDHRGGAGTRHRRRAAARALCHCHRAEVLLDDRRRETGWQLPACLPQPIADCCGDGVARPHVRCPLASLAAQQLEPPAHPARESPLPPAGLPGVGTGIDIFAGGLCRQRPGLRLGHGLRLPPHPQPHLRLGRPPLQPRHPPGHQPGARPPGRVPPSVRRLHGPRTRCTGPVELHLPGSGGRPGGCQESGGAGPGDEPRALGRRRRG
uniref:Uncharacterized protein n=1 Tax=Tetraselmis sp. GSL018 TaxID=582737 RepID=A0A061S3L5_9CHLO